MSDLITGTHLQPEDLGGQNIMYELGRFGQWTHAEIFQPLSTEVEKCKHKDRERMLEPVLQQLGYTFEVCDLYSQVEQLLISSSKSNIRFFGRSREVTLTQARLRILYLFE